MDHNALDGSTLTLEGAPPELLPRFTSSATVDTDLGRFSFGASRHIGVSYMLRMSTPVKFEHEVPLGDGTLLVGGGDVLDAETLAPRYPFVAGVWRGSDHEFMTSFAGSDRDVVVSVFEFLRPEEAGNGARFGRRLGDGWRLTAKGVTVSKTSDDVGTMSFCQMNEMRAAEIPSWAGAPARGGDLYRVESKGAGEEILVVHRTGLLRALLPFGGEQAALDRLAAMSFEWRL